LLGENKGGLFFEIKGTLQICLDAMANQALSYKTTQAFHDVLKHLDQNAYFYDMGEGNLQLCLLLSNFILKDPSVNLSIKEIALIVARSILESGNEKLEMFDLVRLTIGMLRTNYIANNLGTYLKKLFRLTNKEQLACLLQRLFEY